MVYRVSVLAVAVIISSTKTSARIITYVLLCGYSPFRSDDVKELIRETTEAKIEFHERYWKNISQEGALAGPVIWTLSDLLAAKDFILSLVIADPSKRLTADDALQHSVRRSILRCVHRFTSAYSG